jgi:hypothetical protein
MWIEPFLGLDMQLSKVGVPAPDTHVFTKSLSHCPDPFTISHSKSNENYEIQNIQISCFSQMNFTYFPCASTNFFSFTRSA